MNMTQATQTMPAGYKQTEIGVIPVDWDVKKLKDIANYRRGSFPQPYGLDKWYDNNFGMPFVQVVDVDDNFKLKPNTKQKISKEGAKLSVYVKKGTIILTIQGSIGRVCITQYDAYVDRTLLIFESFKEQFDKYFFLLKIFKKFEIEKEKAPGGIIKTITKEALSSFEISYPTNQLEQTAIATVLFDTDALIENLEKLIAKKRAIKQGTMQQLLTGKKRLPGFSGKWKLKKLGEITEMNSGGTPPSKVKSYYGGHLMWASIADMTSIGKYISDTEKKLTEMGLANSSARIFPKNTVLYAMYASIGECCIASNTIATSQAILGIRCGSKINNIYLYYYLNSIKDKVKLLGQQGTQSNLNKGMVENFELGLPEPAEQTAIAAVLSDMDTEIEKLENKLTKYRQIKIGMMQQLLTGKIRIYE